MAHTRRHGTELVRDIQAAVLAELHERGYAGTTYDGVAERAGTSKPVLYRRWSSKPALVLDALSATFPALTVPADTGSLAGDLKALLTAFRSSVEASDRLTVLALLAEPEIADGPAVRELLFAMGTDLVEPLVERARQRGELGERPLPRAVVQLPLDLARHELLVGELLSDATVATIVDEISVPLQVMRSRAPRRGSVRTRR